mmetsp:Transcript_18141/g.51178  ORF Transcript_18141/g.51178 Transcript_18141/m.51178 type:complete len:211 (+) Transcript_18141:168-800(+)
MMSTCLRSIGPASAGARASSTRRWWTGTPRMLVTPLRIGSARWRRRPRGAMVVLAVPSLSSRRRSCVASTGPSSSSWRVSRRGENGWVYHRWCFWDTPSGAISPRPILSATHSTWITSSWPPPSASLRTRGISRHSGTAGSVSSYCPRSTGNLPRSPSYALLVRLVHGSFRGLHRSAFPLSRGRSPGVWLTIFTTPARRGAVRSTLSSTC